MGSLLESCGTAQPFLRASVESERVLRVDKKDLLSQELALVKHHLLPFPVLLLKREGRFSALQMRCTHNDVALAFTGKKLVCHAHGSEFDLQGKVIREPAVRPLSTYRTEETLTSILIHL